MPYRPPTLGSLVEPFELCLVEVYYVIALLHLSLLILNENAVSWNQQLAVLADPLGWHTPLLLYLVEGPQTAEYGHFLALEISIVLVLVD